MTGSGPRPDVTARPCVRPCRSGVGSCHLNGRALADAHRLRAGRARYRTVAELREREHTFVLVDRIDCFRVASARRSISSRIVRMTWITCGFATSSRSAPRRPKTLTRRQRHEARRQSLGLPTRSPRSSRLQSGVARYRDSAQAARRLVPPRHRTLGQADAKSRARRVFVPENSPAPALVGPSKPALSAHGPAS